MEEEQKSMLYKVQWTAGGIFIGTLQQSIEGFWYAFLVIEKLAIPLSFIDLVTSTVCFASIGVFLIIRGVL